jgi:6-phosphogluconolactonase
MKLLKPDIQIVPDSSVLAHEAAQIIAAQAQQAVSATTRFTIALSGGSTPKRLYELLADPASEFRDQVPWEQIHFFWSDERPVGPDHPDSNYRMVNEAMLSHVSVPGANIHRILGEKANAQDAAVVYETELRTFFQLRNDQVPRLDFVLLGMGADGHTASIFPGSEVLSETRQLVAAPWVEKLHTYRITMTLPVLNNAATVLFLVSGADKAVMVNEVLNGESGRFPAQAINPTNGTLTWLLDQPAAETLTT